MDNGHYTETKIAAELGVNRSVIKAIRDEQLTPQEDWLMVRNQVTLTESGVGKVMASLSPPAASVDEAEDSLKKSVAQLPSKGVVVCARIPRNPRMVLGVLMSVEDGLAAEGLGREVRVRVKSNVHFLPGMELPCYQEDWDVWVLDRPCPRWKGRW